MIKECLKCRVEKPESDFYLFADKWQSKKYLSARCRPCHQEYKKESPVATARNRKAEKLKLRYGLTYEEWENLRENEDFACMICGITEAELDRKLDVDHCHSSNKVRGVLCNSCNTILGRAKDNIEVLKAAIGYLEANADGYGGYKN